MRKQNTGFTYIEIIVAAAIIGFVLMGFSQMFIYNTISVKQAKFHSLAYQWASDYMEEIRQMEFVDIEEGTWASQTKDLAQGKQFTRQATVIDKADDLKLVVVEVSWQGISGDKSLKISYYITHVE